MGRRSRSKGLTAASLLLSSLAFVSCSGPTPYNPGDPATLDFHILNYLRSLSNPGSASPTGGAPAFSFTLPFNSIHIAGRIPVQPTDGTPPYTYSVQSSTARISNAGLMTAPENPGTVTFQVTDATGQVGEQTMTVHAGSGNGTFGTPTSIPSCNATAYIEAADFNWDGNLDVVVACAAPGNGIQVHMGKGDGTFETAVSYAGGGEANFLALGDFNGDGNLDIAAPFSGSTNPGLGIYNGNGDGTFQAFQGHITTSNAKTSGMMVAGDFNGDGIDDLILSAGTDTDIYLGTGSATNLGTLSNFNTADSALGGHAGDVDGDGDLDLIIGKVGIPPAGHMRLHLNNGNGTFAAEANILCDAAFGTTNAVPLADFNGDGNLDIACVIGTNNTVGIHPGNGDGSFAAYTQFTTSNNPTFGRIADFNGDGHLDVATAEQVADRLGILLGDGTGSLGSYATNADPITSPNVLAAVDFNNDGKMDLVSTTTTSNFVILIGN